MILEEDFVAKYFKETLSPWFTWKTILHYLTLSNINVTYWLAKAIVYLANSLHFEIKSAKIPFVLMTYLDFVSSDAVSPNVSLK